MPNLCIIPARALDDPTLTGADIKVLCAIGKHTGRDGAGCWASSRTLADLASVSQREFFRATQRLIERGLITRESGHSKGITSTYSVVLDQPTPTSDVVGPAGHKDMTPTSHPPRRAGHTPSINAPRNAPSNAPTTRRGDRKTVEAGELLNAVRDGRSIPFPNSMSAQWQNSFNDTELRVIKAVGVERILSTPPGKDGVLLAQVAQMLAEVNA